MSILPYHVHPRDFQENNTRNVQKYCYYVLERCKRHYLVKPLDESNVNFHYYFDLKAGMIGQQGQLLLFPTCSWQITALLYHWGGRVGLAHCRKCPGEQLWPINHICSRPGYTLEQRNGMIPG